MRQSRPRLEAGIRLRSRLFGRQYAESSLAGDNALNREVQELITEYGYGAVWSRRGLPMPTRSMLTLGLLATLNRPDQLKAQLRGALNVGVTRREIVEIFIHVILYCGAPAGLSAVKVAMEVFREEDVEAGSGTGRPATAPKNTRSRKRPRRATRRRKARTD